MNNTLLTRLGLLLLCFAATPSMARVTLPLYDASALTNACDSALGEAQKRVAGIEAMLRQAKTDKVLGRWNDLQIALADVLGPAYLFAAVYPDDKVRSAGEACTLKYNVFNTELLQNEKLYRRISRLKASNAVDKKLKQDLLEDFEDGGVSLPPQKRDRAKQISRKLEELRQEFDRNIRDNKTRLSFTAEEVKGLPAAYLNKAQRDDAGNY
ncbi:MAG: Zn-dependent oligopeptidase, partial [Burkholderiales bacterium]|nr:Zn-dependent oligopeptidase [Burkholderiales bacterium]